MTPQKSFTWAIAWGVATALSFPAFAAGKSASQANIVLIIADDLGYGSLGCYGSTENKTPHLDHLAAGGMRFTDFHSNGPMCSPTRAALLTGRYPQRCAWVPDEGLSPSEVTVGALLRSAGYRTALIGKWHLGYDFKFHPLNYGFDEFRGFVGGNVDYRTHFASHGEQQLDWWNGKKIANEAGYTTDLLTKYAAEFIARNKDAPFFLFFSHAAPHDPWQSRDPAQTNSPAEIYREMIEGVDASVGAIVATLRTHGLEKNTLLLFCSDNGAAPPRGVPANGRLKGRKGSMHEGGHRVPLIASWPGVTTAGATNNATVMTMDFLPTFTNMAGATTPVRHVIDGIDLMPQLTGQATPPQRALHWLFGSDWAVRRGAWKLVQEGAKELSLVNVEQDLAETTNLAHVNPTLVDELTRLHQQWIASVGNK